MTTMKFPEEKMDAYAFWKRVDEKNQFPTLKLLTETCGVNYQRVKRNRSDVRLPGCEDAYRFASCLGTSIEYLLTGERPQTHADDVYAYMEEKLPSLLEDIERQIRFKKGDGLSSVQ